jgi:alpha-aminoadipate/glutamate carrier protein LysW
MSTKLHVNCVECDAAIELDEPIVGEIVVCPECGVELEILALDPVTVTVAPMEQEDWGE